MSRFARVQEAERVAKAVERGLTNQPRHGKCIACEKPWEDCPHTRQDLKIMFDTMRMVQNQRRMTRGF